MVHNRGELAAERVQIGRGIGLSLGRPVFQKLVLPGDHRPRIDVADNCVTEIGLQYALDAVALLCEGRVAQPGCVVRHVDLAGGIEAHGRRPTHPVFEIALPP